jgi:hypothetical protein
VAEDRERLSASAGGLTIEAATKFHASKLQQNRTLTAEPRRVETAQNSQRSKAINAVLLT